MVAPHVLSFVPADCPAPSIDPAEARWVARELAALIRRVDPESPSAVVLRQARTELESLIRSGDAAQSGPIRVAA